jgi:hypothetical protein
LDDYLSRALARDRRLTELTDSTRFIFISAAKLPLAAFSSTSSGFDLVSPSPLLVGQYRKKITFFDNVFMPCALIVLIRHIRLSDSLIVARQTLWIKRLSIKPSLPRYAAISRRDIARITLMHFPREIMARRDDERDDAHLRGPLII